MYNKFIDYLTNLVESKNSENNKTRLKIFSIISIFLLAIFLFLLTFSATLFFTNDILNVKNQRDQNLIEMMRVNMGEIPRSPSDVRFRMATKIDSIFEKSNDCTLKNELKSFIKPYLNKNEIRINELSEKFINSPETDFNKVLDEEKQVLSNEFKKINIEIDRLSNLNNSFRDSLFKLKNTVSFKIVNIGSNQMILDLLDETEKEYVHNVISNNIEQANKTEENKKTEENIRSKFVSYQEGIFNQNLKENTAQIIKLVDEKSIKERNQVSLETYRKNKAYIFQNQFDICKLSIQYCIEEGMRYFAFYRGLIVVILVFSGLMSICVFAISAKGWNGSDPILKVITMTVAIILGMANLMNLVLKPKDNYVSYIVKAERNEAVQTEIIKFFNNYNNLKEDDIDKLIRKNFDNIIKFSEILPETNEEGLKQGITDLSNLKKEADPK